METMGNSRFRATRLAVLRSVNTAGQTVRVTVAASRATDPEALAGLPESTGIRGVCGCAPAVSRVISPPRLDAGAGA